MLVKKLLIIIPAFLLLLILASAFFVPRAADVAGDPSRQDKLVMVLSADLEEMNPWLSTKTSDTDVTSHIFESLLTADGNYNMAPNLGSRIHLCEEVVLMLEPGMDRNAISAELDTLFKDRFAATYGGMIPYNSRNYSGNSGGRLTPEFVHDLRGTSSYEDQGAQAPQRIVFRFRPDPSAKYGKKDLPSAVVPDMLDILDAHFKTSTGKDKFASEFYQLASAVAWYCNAHGMDDAQFTVPAKPDAKADKAAKDAHAEAVKALSASLTEAAKKAKADAESFEDFQKRMPKARVMEHPIVSATLQENAWWQDYGTRVPVYDADLNEVRELYTTSGELLPRKLTTSEEWAKWGDKLIEVKAPEGGFLRTEPWPGETEAQQMAVTTTYYRKKALTAEDVAFTFDFGGDELVGSNTRNYSLLMSQVRMLDTREVEIVYGELYSPALFDLVSARMLPAHRFTRLEWARQAAVRDLATRAQLADPNFNPRKVFPAKRLQFSKDPIGTGPLKLYPLNGEDVLPKWQSGIQARLERFDEHWNLLEVPPYKYLDFYIFDPDLGQETAEIAFLSGGTDMFAIRSHQVDDFYAMRDRFTVYKRLRLNYEYFGFNLSREHFQDKRVRQALTMAVDVDELITYIANGQAIRVNGPAYPVLRWCNHEYIPDYTFRTGPNKGKTLKELGQKYYPYDLEEAQALLAEAGWIKDSEGRLMKNGKQMEFKIEISGATNPRGKMAILARERWQKLGCKVELSDSEWNVFVNEKAMQRNYDVITLGWANGIGFDKRRLWSSEFISPKGMNFVGFNEAKAEELMKYLLRVYDSAEQERLSHELFNLIADELPYVFTMATVTNAAVDRHIIWRKPIVDANGDPVLGADGKPTYEELPINDMGIMSYKDGLNSFLHQLARTPEIKFPPKDDEPLFAGRPEDGTVGDYIKQRAREAEAAAKRNSN